MWKLSLTLLLTVSASAQTYGIGLRAQSSSEVVVRVAGKETTVRLKGVTSSTDSAKAFVNCLIAGRVVKVESQKVTMLDGNSVADLANEFLQSKTVADPCSLGKASYVPAKSKSDTDGQKASSSDNPKPGTAKKATSKH